MFRYEVQSRLEELARQPDDWFSLGENGDGSFAVRDSAGATADVTVGEQWVEVAARRPLDLGARAVAGGAGTGTLVRVTLAGSGPAGLLIAGRVYLDGFSMQALFLTVRDVLALAGPAPAAAPASGFTASPRLRVDDTPAAEETPASVAIATEGTAGTGAATNAEGPAAAIDPVAAEESLVAEALLVEEPQAVAAQAPVEAPEEPVAPPDEPSAPTAPPPAGATAETAAGERDAMAETLPLTQGERRVPTTMRIAREPVETSAAAVSAEPAMETPAALSCRRCGAPIQPGERFCINCGAPQPSSQEAAAPQQPAAPAAEPAQRRSEPDTVVWRRPPPGMTLCPRCGEANDAENRHCQACGLALGGEGAGAPTTGAEPEAGPAPCGRCGYTNPPGNRFCQGCGAPLGG